MKEPDTLKALEADLADDPSTDNVVCHSSKDRKGAGESANGAEAVSEHMVE